MNTYLIVLNDGNFFKVDGKTFEFGKDFLKVMDKDKKTVAMLESRDVEQFILD